MIMFPRHWVVEVAAASEEAPADADPPQKGTRPAVPTGHMASQCAQSAIHMDRQMAPRARSGSGHLVGELASLQRSHSTMVGISVHRAETSLMAVAVGTRFGIPVVHCITTEFFGWHRET
jgi:hypothetical protein